MKLQFNKCQRFQAAAAVDSNSDMLVFKDVIPLKKRFVEKVAAPENKVEVGGDADQGVAAPGGGYRQYSKSYGR